VIRGIALVAAFGSLAACTPPAKDYAAENRAAPAATQTAAPTGGPEIKFSGYARYGVKIVR
jgi:hypothetical protein